MTWYIVGQYLSASKEVIDEAESRKEANYLLKEYRMAFGPGWSIWLANRKPKGA